MKISISSYSYSKLRLSGEMTQLDTIKATKELGIDAIEFSAIFPHDGSSDAEYAKKLKSEADAVGVEIVNFVFGTDLLNGRQGRNVDQEIEYVKGMIDIAEILGVKRVRHDALYKLGDYPSFDSGLPVLAKNIRTISEYAKSKGIKTMIENHGSICQEPERIERLYNAVNYDNFGILCDIGNFMCSDSDPVKSVAIVAPYTKFVHVKDLYYKSGNTLDDPGEGFHFTRGRNYIKGAPLGHGVVPVTQCLRILKAAGYDGYVTLEYESSEDTMEGIKTSIANLKKYLENI